VTDVSVFETRTEFEGQQKLVDELQRRLEDSEYKLIEGERLRKKLHNTILVIHSTNIFVDYKKKSDTLLISVLTGVKREHPCILSREAIVAR